MGWDVVVVDSDPAALRRMKDDIYPKRYGAWDPAIELCPSDRAPRGGFDVICIGTPPNGRMRLALDALAEKPRVLQLEKPLCEPTPDCGLAEFVAASQAQRDTAVVVGYDHVVSESIVFVVDFLRRRAIGEVETLDIEWGADSKAILLAHPWLQGIADTYLGFWRQGGGASGEHSHALHLWRHLAKNAGLGRWTRMSAFMDVRREGEAEYDRLAVFSFLTDTGKAGTVVQDMVTFPQRSRAHIQGQDGFIEWLCNGRPEGDLVRYRSGSGDLVERCFPKKRPDDFHREMLHIEEILAGRVSAEESPLSLQGGVDVIQVLQAAHEHRNEGVEIRHEAADALC